MRSLFSRLCLSAFLFAGFIAKVQAEPNPVFFFSPDIIQSHLSSYTDEERRAIKKDEQVVRSVCLSDLEPRAVDAQPLFVATAGGPGARKSTILERFLDRHPAKKRFAYIDFDPRTLWNMVHTYRSRSLCHLEVAKASDYLTTAKLAYEKWRWASHFITLTLLEEAFNARLDVAYGTTLTGSIVPDFLQRIRDAGYQITLLLCYAEDRFRQEALNYRRSEQRIWQSDPADEVSKGWLFPERMAVYFQLADTLFLFWSDALQAPERLAAILEHDRMTILDEEALSAFVDKYERDRALLSEQGKQLPAWSELLSMRAP